MSLFLFFATATTISFATSHTTDCAEDASLPECLGGEAAVPTEPSDEAVPLEPSAATAPAGTKTESASPGPLFQKLYQWGIGIAVVLAVLMIVIGGLEYILSAANPTAKEEGKKYITGAILGLVLALFSYVLLQTINPDLINFNIKLPKNNTGGTPSQGTTPSGVGGGNTTGTEAGAGSDTIGDGTGPDPTGGSYPTDFAPTGVEN